MLCFCWSLFLEKNILCLLPFPFHQGLSEGYFRLISFKTFLYILIKKLNLKREVRLFHFENAGGILCCSFPISIVLVQTAFQIWCEMHFKQIYMLATVLLTKKCHQPPGLCPLGKWEFAVTPRKGKANVVMWNKGSFCFAWLLLKEEWSRDCLFLYPSLTTLNL